MWKYYVIFSAFFAALTTILAKIGISGVSGNVASAIRTVLILVIVWCIVIIGGEHRQVIDIPKRSLLFVVLSGVTTGFSFKAMETGLASKVAIIDKLSLAFTLILLREPISLKILIGLHYCRDAYCLEANSNAAL
ncbi:transporter family protein [Runella defluvii]|uniref:Transporter family protein n=1 Tax=Runella defluvii TaxID=370973 RepID=A0A7W5ZUU4_9BACT|nr:EamA family transporter [Runella defluvii]MBB3841962.1 transporter family protein [Runella defluvii]